MINNDRNSGHKISGDIPAYPDPLQQSFKGCGSFGQQPISNNPNYNPNVCAANDNNGDGLLKNIGRDIENSNEELLVIIYKLRDLYGRIFEPNSDSKELTNPNKDIDLYSLEEKLKYSLSKNRELRSDILTLCNILENKL